MTFTFRKGFENPESKIPLFYNGLLKYFKKNIKPVLVNLIYCFKEDYGRKNSNLKYFAGNLFMKDLNTEDLLEICHYLILPNGVRKTTEFDRNKPVFDSILKYLEELNINNIDILDIGSSVGIDALNFYNMISGKYKINSYTLGDLYTEILIDIKNKLVFDQDGKLLQVCDKKYFYSIYFQYYCPLRKYFNFINELRSRYHRIKYKFDVSVEYKKFRIALPELKINEPSSVFKLERMNVFESINNTFDVVICMHLLNDFYFSEEQITRARENLFNAVRPGGMLIVGRIEKYDILYKDLY